MNKKRVIGAVVILISLPMVLALTEAVSFDVRNRNNGSIVSSGQKREYLVYVPRSYHRNRPVPLVISMHGAAGWPVQQMNLSQWNRLAEEYGFIVVYPSGAGGAGPRIWHLDGTKDVTFLSELIDTLAAAYNIDPARIYADGSPTAEAWLSCFPARCPIGSRRSGWWALLNYCRGPGVQTTGRCR